MAGEGRRPLGVTLLVIFVVIQGIISIIGGFVVLSARHNSQFLRDNHVTSSEVTWAAFVAIGLGVFIVLVGLGLGTGSGVARFLVGFFTLLELAGGIYGIVKYSGSQQTSAIVSTVVAVVVLYLLYGSRRNRRFFALN